MSNQPNGNQKRPRRTLHPSGVIILVGLIAFIVWVAFKVFVHQ
jgi:hypothetical protein